jgi:hypothetical protein
MIPGQRFSDAQYALKAATRRAVTMAGGCTALANTTRVDAARLSRYGNIHEMSFAPIDVAQQLDEAAGDHVILRAWADLAGFDLVPREASKAICADVTRQAGEIAKDAGELVSTAIEAAADGSLTPNESIRIDNEAADVQERVVQLRTTVRKAMGR